MEETGLVKFDAAVHAIEVASTVDEVKGIRDKAEAARKYAQQAGLGLGMQNQCADIKIRAERKAGKILKSMEKNRGAATPNTQSHRATTLKDLGIDKYESSRWQLESDLPEDEYIEHVEAVTKLKKELTSASVRRLAKDKKPKPPTPSLPKGKFDVIYADPPWKYDFSTSESRQVETQYPTLELEDIKNYVDKIGRKIQDCVPKNGCLYLWATPPKLVEALAVLDAWGYNYVTHMVWVKDKIGMGYWARQQHELLLIGKRGKFSPPPPKLRLSSVIMSPREKHSQKPTQVYTMLERAFPKKDKHKWCEIFARNTRKGWAYMSNEI